MTRVYPTPGICGYMDQVHLIDASWTNEGLQLAFGVGLELGKLSITFHNATNDVVGQHDGLRDVDISFAGWMV